MEQITLRLPDGKEINVDAGMSALEIIRQEIGEGLARAACACEINGKLLDLTTTVTTGGDFVVYTFKNDEGLEVFRHTSAHLLAMAVEELFPSAKNTIGPVVEGGFYYDFASDKAFTPEDLEKIEQKMKEIAKAGHEVSRLVLSKEEALEKFGDNKYKREIIEEMPDGEEITAYAMGSFVDLCRGPHLPNINMIKAVKLTKTSGAYWRGDEKNDQLQRIYGVTFPDKKQLKEYLEFLEEAKKRDHRILGSRLKLFTISPLVGAGLPLMQPRGMVIRKLIEDYLWDLHKKKGYSRVCTPHIAKKALYETSGHAAKFGDELFKVKGKDEEFILKPMNCPHHMQIFADNYFSYKDMPIRYFEPATVYRDEKSGQLSGLTRVRSITQDDGHLFCRIDQIKEEVRVVVEVIKEFYSTLGMLDEYWVSLSVRDDDDSKYLGSDEVWQKAEAALEDAAKACDLPFKRIEGEAAFYGPKLDFMFKDCIGREWQLSTIQCDFNLPERFDLSFVNEQGEKERPVVIHRAISGSLERFMGILIEHFAGKFPLWLAPVQVAILPISDKYQDYAEKLQKQFVDADIRVEISSDKETLQKKIRDAQLEFIPYILVCGEKEAENQTVNVRTRDNVVHGEKKVTALIEELQQKITEKSLEL